MLYIYIYICIYTCISLSTAIYIIENWNLRPQLELWITSLDKCTIS